MQGNLKQIALPEVLQFISMGKSTGRLTVQEVSGLETTLMIRQGRIINSSALERQRRLGDLLVHRGILKRSVLAQVLNVQRTVENEKRIGEILIERDLIQESQIRDVLRLQLEEEIWNLFALDEGEFHFDQVDEDDLGESNVQIDIEPLLLEGSRRQDEWRRINRLIPSERLVIGVTIPSSEVESKPRLSPAEWRVLSHVNGRIPIRGLINRTGMGRFEVYKILAELLQRNIVFLREEEAVQEEVLQKIEEMQRQSEIAPIPGRSGVAGIFSRLRGTSPPKRDARDRLTFVTPIGSVAHVINKMVDQFLALREFQASNTEVSIIRQLWRDLLLSFTKADLIFVQNNHVHTEKFEEFIRLFEFNDAVQDCYEDSIEALLQLLDGLYRIFAQRTGERTAVRIIREILEDTVPRTTHLYDQDFKLDERIQMVLRLAA